MIRYECFVTHDGDAAGELASDAASQQPSWRPARRQRSITIVKGVHSRAHRAPSLMVRVWGFLPAQQSAPGLLARSSAIKPIQRLPKPRERSRRPAEPAGLKRRTGLQQLLLRFDDYFVFHEAFQQAVAQRLRYGGVIHAENREGNSRKSALSTGSPASCIDSFDTAEPPV